MPTTGPELRKERRDADVTVAALARAMGTTRQTIHGWERAVAVPIAFVEQHRAAVAALRDAKETAA